MNTPTDITKLTETELKALAFDLQNNLNIVINELQKRLTTPKENV